MAKTKVKPWMSQIPIGWLMKIEGLYSPEKQRIHDEGFLCQIGPSIFTQKTLLGETKMKPSMPFWSE